MNALDYFRLALQKYAVFTGRSRRKEYWYFLLFVVLITVGLTLIETSLGWFSEELGIGPLSGLFTLFILVPSVTVAVRRLHDTGRSGWWVLLGFVPLLNLFLLVLMVLNSQPGDNQYGPNPKAVY